MFQVFVKQHFDRSSAWFSSRVTKVTSSVSLESSQLLAKFPFQELRYIYLYIYVIHCLCSNLTGNKLSGPIPKALKEKAILKLRFIA